MGMAHATLRTRGAQVTVFQTLENLWKNINFTPQCKTLVQAKVLHLQTLFQPREKRGVIHPQRRFAPSDLTPQVARDRKEGVREWEGSTCSLIQWQTGQSFVVSDTFHSQMRQKYNPIKSCQRLKVSSVKNLSVFHRNWTLFRVTEEQLSSSPAAPSLTRQWSCEKHIRWPFRLLWLKWHNYSSAVIIRYLLVSHGRWNEMIRCTIFHNYGQAKTTHQTC